jgi:hypothetical protein
MRRSPAVAAAICILATGCGPTTHLKLGLRADSITVPRLVTPAVVLVPPAVTPPPAALPPLPPVSLPPSSAPLPAPSAVAMPANPCPQAGPFDVPAVPATQTVDSPPVPAKSTQLSTGSFTGAASSPASGSLAGNVQTTISRLPTTTSSAGQKVDAWQVVRRGPTRDASSVEVYRLVHPSSAPTATQAGIYLVGLAWRDPARGNVTFQASGNGLEIMSLPAQPATNDVQYVGADTDPNTLTTLELTRNMRQHKRVDACGKLIDTITVEMSGTLTTPSMQRQLTWTQQIATSYGGVDVAETMTLTSVATGYIWTRSLRNTTVPAVPTDAKRG